MQLMCELTVWDKTQQDRHYWILALHLGLCRRAFLYYSPPWKYTRLLPCWSGLFFLVVTTKHQMCLLSKIRKDVFSCALIHNNMVFEQLLHFYASCGGLGLFLWRREEAICVTIEHLHQVVFIYNFKCHIGCFLKIVLGKNSNCVSRQLKSWAAFLPAWFATDYCFAESLCLLLSLVWLKCSRVKKKAKSTETLAGLPSRRHPLTPLHWCHARPDLSQRHDNNINKQTG